MQLKEITKKEFESLFTNENYGFVNGCCFDEETDNLIAFPYYESPIDEPSRYFKAVEIEDNKQGYQSVKDALPPSDGIFYDVMGILWNDNISGGYNYYRGQYQNGFFFFEHSMYNKKDDFRNSNTQKKVIAWKPLLKCTSALITKFCEKQGVL